jgi:hypothetical protein
MNLAPNEFERMQYLLGMERFHQALSAEEGQELRRLLAREAPLAKELEWDRLIEFGITLVGAHHLVRLLTARLGA